MAGALPIVGRIVFYCLTATDATAINQIHASSTAHYNSRSVPAAARVQLSVPAAAGDTFPFVVTGLLPDERGMQGLVLIDGKGAYIAKGKSRGTGRGQWSWPPKAGK
jgi:hypothetical protein